MRKLSYIIAVFMGLCLICPASWASNAFITDTFRISLRRGPSIENRILKFLPSGQPVEVLESKEGWSRIRPIETDQNSPEGWVLNRYLIMRLPWKEQFLSANETNLRLAKDLADARKRIEEISLKEQVFASEVKKYEDALAKTQTEYLKLKSEASDYFDVKAANENIHQKVLELEKENERLMSSQRNRWFALGALILLCGLMIGLLFGRQEKKRKGYY